MMFHAAVRIATQLDLHRCITKMPHTKKSCYERTRLYFLVYLCDHHCSLPYGRPPMTCEMRSLKSPGIFLQSEFSDRAALMLISQVELWSISQRVFDHFGADVESCIASEKPVELERLSNAYDRWYRDWLDALNLKEELDGLSRRIFDLYFHSAKLYLFSHVFRGPPQKDANLGAGLNWTEIMAQNARSHALSLVRLVVDDDEAHTWLGKLPWYIGTMIAFASVWLIRTSLQEQVVSNVGKTEVLDHLYRLVGTLRRSSMAENPRHPFLSIAKSLEMATSKHRQAGDDQVEGATEGYAENMSLDFDLLANDALNFNFLGDNNDWLMFPNEAGLRSPDFGQL